MNPTLEHYARRVMSGEATGPRAALLRGALAAAAVPYAAAMALRNSAFDKGLQTPARLPRPVMSVGNITTGGTGKTPVVRWLAGRLRAAGKTVAVLSRGYKAQPGELGDEQRMLASLLNTPGQPPVIIRADPSRLRSGEAVLREHPSVDVFVLDDAFQHRRLARDFDLVLINAAEPFGFGRVLPRGMLREPLRGLARAHAFLLTRADAADNDSARSRIRETLKRYHAAAPVYECEHQPACFRENDAAEAIAVEALRGRRWLAFCGIGGPGGFFRQLEALGGTNVGSRPFADHHAYSTSDLAELAERAESTGADVLVTTEKDWVKLAALPGRERLPPIWHLDVEIRFRRDDESKLLEQISAKLVREETASSAAP